MPKGIHLIIAVVACLAFASPLYAQDPGIQDSIIIGSAYVDSGAPPFLVGVPLYVVTDDDVASYHIAISYASPDTAIWPRFPFSYFPPINVWSWGLDTAYSAEQYFDLLRFNLDTLSAPFLNTQGLRLQIITLVFNTSHTPSRQHIVLDTTWNPNHGSTYFGLSDGVTAFTPAFVPGYILIDPSINVDHDGRSPRAFSLSQNYPNPFNPSTEISFSVSHDGPTSLVIFDLLGRQVRKLLDAPVKAGSYSLRWDGRNEAGADVPSGVYFYRLTSVNFTDTKRMILLR
jgi:hypothetical protein